MKNTNVSQGILTHNCEKNGFEVISYPTQYEEFSCCKIQIKEKGKETSELSYLSPSIGIVLKGKGTVSVQSTETKEPQLYSIKEGNSFYLLPETKIKYKSEDDELIVYVSTSQLS